MIDFSTLWNYTTLKRVKLFLYDTLVFQYLMKLHYSQTFMIVTRVAGKISVPYEITLLSNTTSVVGISNNISVPYEITLLSNCANSKFADSIFQYLMKLHYSQTTQYRKSRRPNFSTLWNYTTLKPQRELKRIKLYFSPLWNYTTLKPW